MSHVPSLSLLDKGLSLLDKGEVCRLFGGNKPINPSTLYRGIRKGTYPRPVRIGGSSRWLRAECEAALAGMVEGRS
jgi:predicted DNA-binding transcriptional regulator AlpA